MIPCGGPDLREIFPAKELTPEEVAAIPGLGGDGPVVIRDRSPKVLYVGVYRDGTGWGQAATDYILALDAAGVDVVPRPLKLNDRRVTPPRRILELEAKSSAGCDVVIQHCLPHQMDYHGGLTNIGLFASETSDFRASGWAERLACMDEIWVVNRQQLLACARSGLDAYTSARRIRVVPHATDVARFQRSYPVLECLKEHKGRGDFLFYFIGETVRRKNLAALVKAFHLEFDPHEPVGLVIKTDPPGPQPYSDARRLCQEVKAGLKLHGYKEEVIITDRLTEEGMMRLHASCDCFVMPSFGEAWGLPAFDAMAMGRTPIVTSHGGFVDYLSNETGWMVEHRLEPAFGAMDTFDCLCVGTENWASVDVLDLRRCMREAYEQDKKREEKAAKGIERAYDFSHEAIGALMKRLLAEAQVLSHERRTVHQLAGSA